MTGHLWAWDSIFVQRKEKIGIISELISPTAAGLTEDQDWLWSQKLIVAR